MGDAAKSKTVVVEGAAEVSVALAKLVQDVAQEAIASRDVFKIGLSGGSLVDFLEEGLPSISTDWSKWVVFFCDERIVPVSESEKHSTAHAYRKRLLGKVPLTEEQLVAVDPTLRADAAAIDYIQKMALRFPPDQVPRFDILLLGLGPDGHTCSLFPGDLRLLEETSVWVAPVSDSPKPPPERITLTFPVLNNAACCVFALAGQAKAPVVKRILQDKEPLPAALVQPQDGQLVWILDKAAASLLDQ